MGQQVAQSTDKARAGMARMGAQTGIIASGFARVLGVSNPMVASLASVESGAVAAATGMSGMTGAAGGLGRALTAMLGPLGLVFAAVTVAVAIWEKFTAAQKESEKQAEKEQEALAKVADEAKKIARSMKEAGEVVFRLPSIPSIEEEARSARIDELRVKKLSELLKGLGPSADVAAIAAASREADRFAQRRFEAEERRAKAGADAKKRDLEFELRANEMRQEFHRNRIKEIDQQAAAGASLAKGALKNLRDFEREQGVSPAGVVANVPGLPPGSPEALARIDRLVKRQRELQVELFKARAASGEAGRLLVDSDEKLNTLAGERVIIMGRLGREREVELEMEGEAIRLETERALRAKTRLEILQEEEAALEKIIRLLPPFFFRFDPAGAIAGRIAEINFQKMEDLLGMTPPSRAGEVTRTQEPLVEENFLRDERNRLMIAGASAIDAENTALANKADMEKRINELMSQGIDLENARKIAAEQSLETFTRFNVTMEEGVMALGNWVAGFGTAEAAARGLGGYIGTEFLNVMGAGVQAAMRQAIGASVQFTHANKESQRQAKAMELTAGQAFKAAARDAIVAVAAQASVKAIFATAEGIFAAAHGNAPAAAGFFAAAHMYASIAGVAALAAQMIGPVRKTIPDTGGGGAGAFSTDRPTPEGGGPQEINITVNVAPGSSPEDVGRAIVQQIQAFERDQNKKVLMN